MVQCLHFVTAAYVRSSAGVCWLDPRFKNEDDAPPFLVKVVVPSADVVDQSIRRSPVARTENVIAVYRFFEKRNSPNDRSPRSTKQALQEEYGFEGWSA